MLPLKPFQLERYFAQYEFSAPYLLSPSDCESLRLDELLALADAETAGMWQDLRLGYTESQGHPRLRAAIAEQYSQLGPADILVAAPEEGILLAMQALLAPGDGVVVIHPAYQSLSEIAAALGCQVTRWPVIYEGGQWRLDLAGLESRIDRQTRLLVLNFPHNPTGCLPTRAELEAVLQLARQSNLIVFSDEMYRLLEYDPSDRLPPVCELYERAVSLAGMSKAYALPGLRIGWLASRLPGLIERCQALKDYTTICSSAPAEVLALMALRASETILARNLAIIQSNLEIARAFFARHAQGLTWIPPKAGSVAFPRWIGPGMIEDFCRQAVERQGVMIVPGSLFDFPGGYFRLGLGRANFPEALARLEPLLA
jgi:aspartate/methionine/tyrosine aminotransferase